MNLNSRIEVGMKDGSLLKCEIVESFFFEGSHFVAFKSVEPPKQHAQFFMSITNENENIFFKMTENKHEIARIKESLMFFFDKEHTFKIANNNELNKVLITGLELRNYYQMEEYNQDISVVNKLVGECKMRCHVMSHHVKII